MIADMLFTPARQATDFGPLSDFWYNPVSTPSSAGIVVKPDNALSVSAVFGCIRFLSEIVGSLDYTIRTIDGDKGTRGTPAPEHEFYNTLYRQPNRWQTPMEWGEMGMAHLCLRGNFYCQIFFNEEGKWELLPLNPDRMKAEFVEATRMVRYTYQRKIGQEVTFKPGEIFHVRGMSLDGVTGVSVLTYAKNAVGSAIAQETHGASLFKNGGLPSFWIGRPQGSKFTAEARRNFRAGWRKLHGGPENAGNPPILEDGMELHQLGLTNKDSQWLESRGFQTVEICRFFRVNPRLVFAGTNDKGDLEELNNETKRYTLFPWCKRWSQAIGRDLLDNDPKHFAHINLDELALVDMLARYEANNYALQGGWKTRNEVRGEEGLDPVEGGDVLLQALNMQPAGGSADWNEQGGRPGKGTPKGPKQKEEEPPEDNGKEARQRVENAFVPIIEDVARRISAAEIHGLEAKADKASKDRKRFNDWAKTFYDSHGAYVEKTIAPLVAAWNEAAQEAIAADVVMTALGVMAGGVFDSSVDVPALLEDWRETRAGVIATELQTIFYRKGN